MNEKFYLKKKIIICTAPDEMVDTLKPVVDKLHMKGGFDPNKFNNPGKSKNLIYIYSFTI